MAVPHVQAVSMAFKKLLIERSMSAELSHHLDKREGELRQARQDNHHNGYTGKTVLTMTGRVPRHSPRLGRRV